MGKKKERATIMKVAISYLILIAIGVGSIYFVYRNTEAITEEIGQQTTYQQQEELVNTILTDLLNAENHIGPMMVDTSDFNLYKEQINLAENHMDTLKGLLSDAFQIQSLDSVSNLLKQKEENLCELIKLTNKDNLEELYKANIRTMLMEDSLRNYASKNKNATMKQDTIIKKRHAKKRNFFHRLAEAFSRNGGPNDTTIRLLGTERQWMDSLSMYYNPTDTAQSILDDIKVKIRNEKYRTDKAIMAQINTLRNNNNNITIQAKSILGKIEFDNRVNMQKAKSRRNATLAQTAEKLRYVTVLSIIVILLFCWILFNDMSRSRKLREQLEEKNLKQERMMISLTHDMKAPMGSAIGYMELMGNTPLSEKQQYYLENMRKSSNQTIQLITNILDNNKLDSSKMMLQPTLFSVKDLIEEVYASFEPIAQKKNISLKHQVSGFPDKVTGDVTRIQQICNNLVSNAIKFTEEGEVSISADVVEDDVFHILTISVADTGIGISEEDIDGIFGEYKRIIRDGHAPQEGSGLGLSIVSKLVDLYNGDIDVKSKIDEGTTITVTIKLQKEEEPDTTEAFDAFPINVLILDDDDTQLTLVSEILTHANINVFPHKDPEDALKEMESQNIDLILTDIQMPSINGFEFVKLIRQSPHISHSDTLPIIALSARADISEEHIKEQGFDGFICKPFTSQELIDTIRLHTKGDSIALPEGEGKVEEPSADNTPFYGLLSYACGDKESEAMILDSFIRESTSNVKELKKAWLLNDTKEMHHYAHKMLPLFRSLQKKGIVEKLTVLEREDNFKKMISRKEFLTLTKEVKMTLNEARELMESYK
ncbi:MAG: response regulator [Paludibacteraceae bacterium]|nr:response regulator [Paludibacteraceae bacterium]